jgi:hypothetical protein
MIFQREDGWCESLWSLYGSSLGALNRTDTSYYPSRLQRIPTLQGRSMNVLTECREISLNLGGNTD